MVLAHDANCFIDYFGAAHDAVRAAAAPNWHYEHISDDVLPALLDAGVTQAQIDTMLMENPVRYFTPGRRAVRRERPGLPDRSKPGRHLRHDRRHPRAGRHQALRRAAPQPGAHAARVRRATRAPRRPSSRPAAARRLSYASLWDRAARVAGGLRALGVQRGDRVAIRLGNGVDWVLAFFGAVLADAIVVPVNTRFTEEEADYVVTDSGATYVFAPGAALPDGDPLVVDDQARPTRPRSSTPAAPRASPRAP